MVSTRSDVQVPYFFCFLSEEAGWGRVLFLLTAFILDFVR